MAVWSAGIVIIAVVIMDSIIIGFGDSRQRGWRNRDDDDDDDDDRRRDRDRDRGRDRDPSLLLCPCSQGCCDDQWYQYKDACYFPVRASEKWEQAKQHCEHLDAHLASVHSEDEDSFIFHLMWKTEGYWLGAEKIDARNEDRATHWRWIDNSPWDYSKMINNNNFMHGLAVDKIDNEDKTYWKIVRKVSEQKYVCKYLLN